MDSKLRETRKQRYQSGNHDLLVLTTDVVFLEPGQADPSSETDQMLARL